MIERELINKIPGAVDFSEPQTGRKVNEFSYCPKFEQREHRAFRTEIAFFAGSQILSSRKRFIPRWATVSIPRFR